MSLEWVLGMDDSSFCYWDGMVCLDILFLYVSIFFSENFGDYDLLVSEQIGGMWLRMEMEALNLNLGSVGNDTSR